MTRQTENNIFFGTLLLVCLLIIGAGVFATWSISTQRSERRKEIQSHAYVIYPLTKYGRSECEVYASDQAPTVGENGVWIVVDLEGRTHWHSPSSVEIVKNKGK